MTLSQVRYPPSSWVHLRPIKLGSASGSCLGADGVGMTKPVLEKAPDLAMNLASAVIPSTVPRIVDRARDREASLRMSLC